MTARYPVKVLLVIGYVETAAARADFLASVKRSNRGGFMDVSIPCA